jgi:hypothetical protein
VTSIPFSREPAPPITMFSWLSPTETGPCSRSVTLALPALPLPEARPSMVKSVRVVPIQSPLYVFTM